MLPLDAQRQLEQFLASLGKLAGTCARLGESLSQKKKPRRSGHRRIFWTVEDLKTLRKLYPIMRTDDLADAAPGLAEVHNHTMPAGRP